MILPIDENEPPVTSQGPTYELPPVVEVVVAVSFSNPPLTVVQLAEFGAKYLREELPNISEQPPYQMPIENYGSEVPTTVSFSVLQTPPPPRLWFRSLDGRRLVQLQRDWFACNWQDAETSPDTYPRFPAIEAMFVTRFAQFEGFLMETTGSSPNVTQCEITYVNHIHQSDHWSRPGEAHRMNRLIGRVDRYLPEPDNIAANYRFTMSDADGKPLGRLHATLTSGRSADTAEPVLVLNMLARGAPIGEGLEGIRQFNTHAHEWIVEGFAAMATADADADWRKRGSDV